MQEIENKINNQAQKSNYKSSVSSQEESVASELDIPLYTKTLSIPQIQPNCLEVVDTSTIAFACTNGFYIAKFEDEDTLELVEVMGKGNFWDVVYFPHLQIYYTYNYLNNKIYSVNPYYQYSAKDIPVFADGDSRSKQLRADTKQNLLFVSRSKTEITVFDVQKDFNNSEILKAISSAKKAAKKIKDLKNKVLAKKMILAQLRKEKQSKSSAEKSLSTSKTSSIKLNFNKRKSTFESYQSSNQNFSSKKKTFSKDKVKETQITEEEIGEDKIKLHIDLSWKKASRNLDFLVKNITKMLDAKKTNPNNTLKRRKKKKGLSSELNSPSYSHEDLRNHLDSINLSDLSDKTCFKFKVKDIPGDFIRDFKVDEKKSLLAVLTNDCVLSLHFYNEENSYMFNFKKLGVRGIGYTVSLSPGSRYICVSTTTLNLNLIDMLVLELDSKYQLHEIFKMDYTSSSRFAQPYSCFGFCDLGYWIDQEQFIVCGQECADNNLLVYQLRGKNLIKMKAKSLFSSFVNKAHMSNGWLWVAEQNGNLNMIRLGQIEGLGPRRSMKGSTIKTQTGNFLTANEEGYQEENVKILNFNLEDLEFPQKSSQLTNTFGQTKMIIQSGERTRKSMGCTATLSKTANLVISRKSHNFRYNMGQSYQYSKNLTRRRNDDKIDAIDRFMDNMVGNIY